MHQIRIQRIGVLSIVKATLMFIALPYLIFAGIYIYTAKKYFPVMPIDLFPIFIIPFLNIILIVLSTVSYNWLASKFGGLRLGISNIEQAKIEEIKEVEAEQTD